MRSLHPLVLVLAIGVTAACGDDGGQASDAAIADAALIDALPRDVITSTQLLVPGELVEGIMVGGPGDRARIELSAATPTIDWNIHGHANGGTQVVSEEFDVAMVAYEFNPSAESSWYLLVRNGGTTDLSVDVRVELFGDLTWTWQ